MNYVSIFEYNGTSFFHIIPLLGFALTGAGLIYSVKSYVKTITIFRQALLFFGYLFGGVASILLIISLINLPSSLKESREFKISKNSSKVVEGSIEHLVPINSKETHFESFSVKGVNFRYSDHAQFKGFHQISATKGLIDKNGQKARIRYTTKNGKNLILKLEIVK